VNGNGDPIPDRAFEGGAQVMKGLMFDLRDQLIGGLWQAKANSWILVRT